MEEEKITIKQNVRFQERRCILKNFDLIKFKMAAFGHYSLSHGRYLLNCARLLDHYYKKKCEISGENASGKN